MDSHSEAAPDEDFDFGGMHEFIEELDLPAANPQTTQSLAPEAAPPPAAPQPAPVKPEAQPTTQTAQPPAQPPAPAVVPPAPGAEGQPTAEVPLEGPEAVLAEFAKNEKQILENILPGFQLSEELRQELETDAVAVVPKLLAQNFLRSTQAAVLYMQRLVPQMVQAQLKQFTESFKTANAFYSKYPEIKQELHEADAVQFAKAFKHVNPKLTQAELFDLVANAVRVKYGLTPGRVAAPPSPAAPQPKGFVPANNGTVIQQTTVDDNAWSGLHQEFD